MVKYALIYMRAHMHRRRSTYSEWEKRCRDSTGDRRKGTNVYFQNKYLRKIGIKRMCFLFDLRLYFSFRFNSPLFFLPRPCHHHSSNHPTTHLFSTSSPLFCTFPLADSLCSRLRGRTKDEEKGKFYEHRGEIYIYIYIFIYLYIIEFMFHKF